MMEAMEYAALNPFEYEIMNLGNSAPKSLVDVRNAVEEVVGKPAKVKVLPHRSGEMLITYADVNKAKRLVGYDPKTPLEEMIRKYYKWFLKQEEWYKRDEVY
jgi:UDP-glucuronate 4-epimerase